MAAAKPKNQKPKTPAIVLLTIDSINQGIIPSESTLEAIFDELSSMDHALKLAKALRSANAPSSKPVEASQAPVAAPKKVENRKPPQRVKQKHTPRESDVLTPATLGAGKLNVITKGTGSR